MELFMIRDPNLLTFSSVNKVNNDSKIDSLTLEIYVDSNDHALTSLSSQIHPLSERPLLDFFVSFFIKFVKPRSR